MIFQKAITLPLIAASLAFSTACVAKPSPEGYLKAQAQTKAQAQVKAQTNHAHIKTSAPQQYLKPGAAIN